MSVDWLNFTLRPADAGTTPEEVCEKLQAIVGCDFERRSGMHGYEFGIGNRDAGVAVCWGGEHQRGSMWVSLSGTAIAKLTEDTMSWLQLLLYDTLAKITRIDLAVDFFAGEYAVTDCVEWWRSGVFTLRGRRPSTSLVGDWIEGRNGRTLYVGKAKNGKLVRCYEKGIQLGKVDSKWLRVELQLTAVDRVIPHDVLDDPGAYFQGAARWPFEVGSMPLRIKTRVEREAVAFEKMVHETRRAYGTFIWYLQGQGMTPEHICEALARPGIPRRLFGPTGEQLRAEGNAASEWAAQLDREAVDAWI